MLRGVGVGVVVLEACGVPYAAGHISSGRSGVTDVDRRARVGGGVDDLRHSGAVAGADGGCARRGTRVVLDAFVR